jgi:predicted Co/Zn/Cd cation transporter (cation efflux family)
VCAAIGCLVPAAIQRHFSRKAGSPLLSVDARNWFVDGVVSSGVGLTFLAAFFLERSAWKHLVPYVDPILVVVMAAVLIRIPLMTVRENLLEVLRFAPEKTDQQEVRSRVESAIDVPSLRKVNVGMVKIGRFFYVMVHVILPRDYRVERIGDLDEVRQRIFDALRSIPLKLVVDTVFTAEERWAVGLGEKENE